MNAPSATKLSTCTNASRPIGKRFMPTRCHKARELHGGFSTTFLGSVPYVGKDSETDQPSESTKEKTMPTNINGICQCGCGGECKPHNKFIHGHNARVAHYPTRAAHWNWRGGRFNRKGYWHVLRPEHHFANSRGYICEHRLAWETKNKAILLPWAEAPHINGIKDDNRPENIQVMSKRQHSQLEQQIRRRSNIH